MIRPLFPTIVGLPIILCEIVQAGACHNLYAQEIGIALLCLLTIIVMDNFILWDAKTLGFIDYPALHHPLTGLSNRLLFNPKLSLEIALNQQLGSFLAVLFLDLDRFKLTSCTILKNRLSGLFHKKIHSLWNRPESLFIKSLLRMVQHLS